MTCEAAMLGVFTRGVTVRHAVLLSFCVVAAFVVGEGLLLLPKLLDRHVPRTAIYDCVLRDEGASALSLFRVSPSSTDTALKFVLGSHDLSTASPDVRVEFSGIDPITAMTAAGELVVIAGGSAPGSIYTLDLLQSPPSANLLGRQTDGDAAALAVSSDRKWLVSLGPESLYVWDLADRRLKWHRAGDGVACIKLAPRSDQILCGLSDGRVVEMDLAEGEVGRTIATHRAGVASLALCPSGQRLASVGDYERIIVSDLASGTPAWSESHPRSHIAIFSPDGQILVTSPLAGTSTKGTPTLALHNANTGGLLGSITGHGDTILGAAFADDSVLYSWGLDGTVRAWDVRQRKALRIVMPALQFN